MKSGNINFLEPSGPLQACNGTAVPLLYQLEKGGTYGVPNRSLWDPGTELSKARNTCRKGLPVRDALVDSGSSLSYDI